MHRDILIRMFQINQYAALKNVDGFTHEESLRGPDGGGSCANWVLGHIVSSRNHLLGLLGAEAVLPSDRLGVYQRGSGGLGGQELPFESLVQAFVDAQGRIEAALLGMSDERFAELVAAEKPPENPAMLQFHEAYHIGQLGLLRRIVGKSGAIQ